MRWQVVGRHNGKRRAFTLNYDTFDVAKSSALHIVSRFYASNSGKLGNEIWRNGVITLYDRDGQGFVIRDPNEESTG